MRNYTDPSNEGKYQPSLGGVGSGTLMKPVWDPTESVAPLVAGDNDPGSYNPSFHQNWRPRPSSQAPYNSFGGMGPNMPRGPTGTSVDPAMPYMGQHLPISPGDPGWTAPPSLSGPHNRSGDIARPGYDRLGMPMDLSSIPGTTLNSVPPGAGNDLSRGC